MYAIDKSKGSYRRRSSLFERGLTDLRRRREARAWQAALHDAADMDPRLAAELRTLERHSMR